MEKYVMLEFNKDIPETFEQGMFNKMLVDFSVKKYLPFNFFDDEETVRIFNYLNPCAKFPTKSEMKNLILTQFAAYQIAVFRILKENDSKLSFTLDAWTTINNKSYYGITGHFLDSDWKLHSLVVDFISSNGKNPGKDIANMFFKVLVDNNLLNKLQGVTVDNAAANSNVVEQLTIRLKEKNIIPYNTEDLHFRCFDHIINLAAQDFIRDLQIDIDEIAFETDSEAGYDEADDIQKKFTDNQILAKLRTLLQKIKTSERLSNKFKNCCETLGVKMETLVCNESTQWHLTYEMINMALRVKDAINLLIATNRNLKYLQLKETDWEFLSSIAIYLKNFKILSNILSGDKYVTLPSVVVGFNMLLGMLESSFNSFEKKILKNENDIKLKRAISPALEKLKRHYTKTNWIYCATLILDPRHKIKHFEKSQWGKEMQASSADKFFDMYKKLYFKPNKMPAESNRESCADSDIIDVYSFYSNNFESTDNGEIERYLAAPCVPASKDFDIAKWWKDHIRIYPNLSRMAKDILSIQATSVSTEKLSSRAGVNIKKQRNRLNNDSARACICLNSWANCSLRDVIKAKI